MTTVYKKQVYTFIVTCVMLLRMVRAVVVVVSRGEDGRQGNASETGNKLLISIHHYHQRHSNSRTRRDTLSYSPATRRLRNSATLTRLSRLQTISYRPTRQQPITSPFSCHCCCLTPTPLLENCDPTILMS